MINSVVRSLALLSLVTASATASPATPPQVAAQSDTVVFAGGCFWGVQAVFQHVKGVVSATSGYAGGTVVNPDYEQVSTGRTGHAESVRVVFDPAKVSYEKLLEVFFTVAHDPTQLNYQGPDHGTQYRSAVFYMSDAQHAATNRFIAQLEKSGAVRGPIVTQVAALKAFYVAESYHQDYATIHPDAPYIVYNDAPKIEALKRQYATIWNDRIAGH
ncbi:MAG: Peptide methionine sulfoxide reductase msrA [Gemmatimonadetes bacterium]|nr:Peptide methionine sulfoxide reductase msrA [Gemmatimonadota bacterium]